MNLTHSHFAISFCSLSRPTQVPITASLPHPLSQSLTRSSQPVRLLKPAISVVVAPPQPNNPRTPQTPLYPKITFIIQKEKQVRENIRPIRIFDIFLCNKAPQKKQWESILRCQLPIMVKSTKYRFISLLDTISDYPRNCDLYTKRFVYVYDFFSFIYFGNHRYI